MIPEDIKKLISHTLRKERDNPEPETLEKLGKQPLLTIYTIDLLKPEVDSLLTT